MPPFNGASLCGSKRTFLNLKTNCSDWGLVFQRQTFIWQNELLFLTGECLRDNEILTNTPGTPDAEFQRMSCKFGDISFSNSNQTLTF